MARVKREFDVQEVEEIVLAKLNDLGGIKKKLTYNNVYEYNKKIANNPEFKRSNGNLFTMYGYDFWASHYKGEDYYGRKKIDEIKNNSNVIIAGKEFDVDMQDIITLVNDYHEKPTVLSKKLLVLFDRDRNKLKNYEKENKKLSQQVNALNLKLKLFEEGFVSLFYNSSSAYNSLENVMAMNKSKDSIAYSELKKMFSDESRLNSLLNRHSAQSAPVKRNQNVIPLENSEEIRKKRRGKYEDKL